MATTKPDKTKSANGVHKRKRKYDKTTAVGRVVRNLGKARHAMEVALTRLVGWEYADDPRLLAAIGHLRDSLSAFDAAETEANVLFDSGWTPPKKSLALVFDEGEEVQICTEHRELYLKVYSSPVIERLTVVKMVDKQVAVRHGTQSPFLVAKSHIERRPREALPNGSSVSHQASK